MVALGSDARRGLSRTEARARLDRFGANVLTAEEPVADFGGSLSRNSGRALVVLLLVATAISATLAAIEHDAAWPYEAIAIFAVILLNAVMGYVQSARAEQAVRALKQMSAAHANVIRDNEREDVAATDLVPGDIIVIEEGDTIPADARVLQVNRAPHWRKPLSPARACPWRKMPLRCPPLRCSATATTWSSAALRRPMAAPKPWSRPAGVQTEMGRIAGMLEHAPAQSTPLQQSSPGSASGSASVVVPRSPSRMIVTIVVVVGDTRASGIVRCVDSRRRAGRCGGPRQVCRPVVAGGAGARRATNGAPAMRSCGTWPPWRRWGRQT